MITGVEVLTGAGFATGLISGFISSSAVDSSIFSSSTIAGAVGSMTSSITSSFLTVVFVGLKTNKTANNAKIAGEYSHHFL